MFPQFGATAETLSKASTMVFRIGTDAHLYDDPEDVNILPLLDSRFDSDKCEALKRLLALIAQGFDVSNFFPQVVKNVASQSLEVKKLAYLYLLHYAEKRPNEALLSINCFQKDLNDPNPLVRAWALRTMAGIRLHMISPLVMVALNKCARDPSVYVRKCAANALPKLHDLRQEEHSSAIEEIIRMLLIDNSPGVIGAAAASFASVCPNNFSLIGKNYKRLCEILPDVEEWGQIILIGILLRYVVGRHGLVKESIMYSLHCKEGSLPEKLGSDPNFSTIEDSSDTIEIYDTELANMISRCYIEGSDEYVSRSSYNTHKGSSDLNTDLFTSSKTNDDVKMLLRCTSPLLWSHNSAVVLAAAGVHWIMAAKEDVRKIVKPLLFLLRSSNVSKYVVLCNIQVFAKAIPSLFAPHFEDFFIYSSDSYPIKALKLEILSSIATESYIAFIFKEFQDYIRDPDRRFAADTVAAIGLCAQRLPKHANACLEGLVALITQGDFESADGEADVLIHAIMSIKYIIKQDPPSNEKVVIQLIRKLDSIKVPAARAMIIWMVGEYSTLGEIIPKMLTTVLQYLASSFVSEALESKLQIINTAVKVLLHAKGEELLTHKRVVSYVLALAECDLNYDIRDRARFLRNIISCNLGSLNLEEEANNLRQHKELSNLLTDHIFREQPKASSFQPNNFRFYLPGSLSQIVLHAAPGYEPLPKPCSLLCDDSNASDNPESESGSLDEETASDYSSRHDSSGSDESGPASEADNHADPLVQISDSVNVGPNEVSESDFGDLGELMSKRTLETWLDEQPGVSSQNASEMSQVCESLARISVGNLSSRIKPKSYMLVDPTNADGLKVLYSFSSETSTISSLLVCVELLFENSSTESLSEVTLVDEESNKTSDSTGQASDVIDSSLSSINDVPTLVPIEEIHCIEPGETTKRLLQVRFHHHLLPLKLTLYSNGKKIPVRLRPDIGYFVKPLPMDIETFKSKESCLPGMFEYIRRCAFTDHMAELSEETMLTKDHFLVICKRLALKMLSNANLYLVTADMPVSTKYHDDATGLCLRFSSEILSNSIPCLITITVEGKCSEPLNVSVKVNCEETVFGLNLLNRVVNFLVEPSSA